MELHERVISFTGVVESFSALRCAHCGDSVGVYEPLWLRCEDGSLEQSSYIALRQDTAQDLDSLLVYHESCLPKRP